MDTQESVKRIGCGQYLVEHADLSGSSFDDVNMAGVSFNNINLSHARLNDVNLSDVTVTAVQMGGAVFKHIGLPPGSSGRQRPIAFQEADLHGLTMRQCDLSDARLDACKLSGMRIDGILVTDLLAAYRRR